MAKKNETAEKCEAILRKMLETANAGTPLEIHADWGGSTLTVIIEGKGHWHVGAPEGSFEQMVDHMHGVMTREVARS